MRIILLFLLCTTTITASAQWWQKKKPLEPRPPLLEEVDYHPATNVLAAVPISHPRIHTYALLPSDFNLEANEDLMMKTAQHNMRFRIYNLASYNFAELAQLYVQQNRFSEAKWYFLQSTHLARQQKNDQLVISDLSRLAMVKSAIGDFLLAQQDLTEARNIASSRGWLAEMMEVEKKLNHIQRSRFVSLRDDTRYAELAEEN